MSGIPRNSKWAGGWGNRISSNSAYWVFLFAVFALFLTLPARAVEIEPVIQARLLGGQYFLEGERGTLSGNVSGVIAPAVVLNDRWTLLPSVSSMYRGTKQVKDLVGAGSLFQEQMDHRAAVKVVYRPETSKWRLKYRLHYKMELLKETRDESWLDGLFDYRTVGTGLEAEYVYAEPFAVRAAYDYSYLSFPNYTSLESQAALDFQGQPLARELVGDHVLDCHIHMLTAGAGVPVRGALASDSRLVFQIHRFPSQQIVEGTGLLTRDTRSDYVTLLETDLRLPFEVTPDWRILASLSVGLTNAVSNQNSYDASRARYLPQYYNYTEFRVGPELKSSFGDERQPIGWSLGLQWSRRRYPHRPVQDESGTYQADTLRQNGWMLSTTLTYPVAPRFSLLFNLQHGSAGSNQAFEQFYSYNYTATNYLFGISYDY